VRQISLFIFWLIGWKADYDVPKNIDKAVLMVAPHTSNWDFMFGRLYAWIVRIPVRFLIKKELYFWPMGWFIDLLGGVPVDRKKSRNTVDAVAALFPQYDKIYIAITPEGTRKLSHEWKKGFYYIAQKANVPILLSYIDYEKKMAGMGKPFTTTGDIEADLEEIKKFYETKIARFPEMYNLSKEVRGRKE